MLCAHKVIYIHCLRLVAISYEYLCYVAMTMVMLDYMCVQTFMSTHTLCFMLIVKDKVISTSPEAGCYGYEYVTLP